MHTTNGTPLQYSCLENPMDGGTWQAAVHGVIQSQTLLSVFTFTFHFHALEKEMQPTPVFLPGESLRRGSLVGCRLWDRTESDMTEATQQQQQHAHYHKNNFTIKELKDFYYLHYNSNNMNLKKNQSITANLKLPCMQSNIHICLMLHLSF